MDIPLGSPVVTPLGNVGKMKLQREKMGFYSRDRFFHFVEKSWGFAFLPFSGKI